MKEIVIYTGPIEQGKSTALFKWAKSKNAAGVFCLWKNGLKHLLLWPDDQWIPFQANDASDKKNTIKVGRYRFYKEAFNQADQYLRKIAQQPYNYLIVDEAGKLELNGEGLDTTIRWLLESEKTTFKKLVLMVRDTLVDDIITRYKLKVGRVVSTKTSTNCWISTDLNL